ncbi:MAG: vWA domain-containing protein [Rhodospirillales bacterium]
MYLLLLWLLPLRAAMAAEVSIMLADGASYRVSYPDTGLLSPPTFRVRPASGNQQTSLNRSAELYQLAEYLQVLAGPDVSSDSAPGIETYLEEAKVSAKVQVATAYLGQVSSTVASFGANLKAELTADLLGQIVSKVLPVVEAFSDLRFTAKGTVSDGTAQAITFGYARMLEDKAISAAQIANLKRQRISRKLAAGETLSATEIRSAYKDRLLVTAYDDLALEVARLGGRKVGFGSAYKNFAVNAIPFGSTVESIFWGSRKTRRQVEAVVLLMINHDSQAWERAEGAVAEHFSRKGIEETAAYLAREGFGSSGPGGETSRRQVVVLVDSSGSMKGRKLELCHQALEMISSMAGDTTSVGLISFDTSADILVSPAVMGSFGSPPRQNFLAAALKINANGNTDIRGALRLATELGRRDLQAGVDVLLMTDGQDTVSHWKGESDAIPAGTKVHTVALTDEADRESLAALSRATGGIADIARDAGDLKRILTGLFVHAQGEDTLFLTQDVLKPGETRTFALYAEPGLESIQFTLDLPGSDIDLVLTSPSGQTIDTAGAVASRTGVEGKTYDIIRIDRPAPGQWRVKAVAVEVDPAGEPFSVRVSGKVRERKSDWRLLSDSIFAGEPFDLRLVASGDVRWGQADLLVWAPGGDVALKLPVDIAADGAFRVPRLKGGGLYRLQLNALGATGAGQPINRVFDRTIEVHAARPGPAPKPAPAAKAAPQKRPEPQPAPPPAPPASGGWQAITQ